MQQLLSSLDSGLEQMNNLNSNLSRFSVTFSILIYSDNLFKVVSSMIGQKR